MDKWIKIKVEQFEEMDQKSKLYDEGQQDMSNLKSEIDNIRQLVSPEWQDLPEITEKERTILNYITDNPGITKQRLVEGLDGKYSRGPIFNSLKKLEKWHMIDIKRDKPNSQTHNLFTSDNNPILNAEKNVRRFSNAFFNLIYVVREKELLLQTLNLYRYLINAYVLTALIKWPYEMNKISLYILHRTIFSEIFSMQYKLIDMLSDRSEEKRNLEIYCKEVLDSSSELLLLPKAFNSTFKVYKKYNLSKEIVPILDSLWEISLPLFNSSMLNPPIKNENLGNEKEDWKAIG